MADLHPLKELVALHKLGVPVGIYSACSANEFVIEAVMERALELDNYVLIEATANQVNQFGGYTNMKPLDFKEFVYGIAKKIKFPEEKIILGGDHLGPLTWKNEKSKDAMEKSCELIKQYVMAGFTKIHIDTSMHLADDNINEKLDTGIIAERGALLCKVAEEAYAELLKNDKAALQPVYVVGSEVPVPGGIQEEEEGIQVTKVCDFEATVETFKQAFYKLGLQKAWDNVIAVVVQPGVEFGDETIHEYDREAAKELSQALKSYPNLVFEGHSTDYQTRTKLREMVQDGIAILKVGPALTFALREGLFSLCMIEEEIFRYNPDIHLSNLISIFDEAMLQNPDNWNKHYHGNGVKIRFARKYSFSDRCRYYLPDTNVQNSIRRLLQNLGTVTIPLSLLSEYMPIQYSKVRSGKLHNDPVSLLKDRVVNCIDDYLYATKQDDSFKSVVY
ncbi:class II D-tagatose-bisphosphate aldolase, non-catalytic subunit [Ruminiclostridium herbifermentans]|uniref:Class II D-tagatose-bisphosphate aldolase, non-catalytic subunit n=1 Tax=Ruminiclostridium herbifermentans TaxID=2488810 RepID=A0A4U7JK39_9FIRM|nr:class II D-tagatose-bisphosphate aldolase, non-catalytic subunit [Ruminiclostridium herbifermentans]QNU68194.1 class II D-tagatose-bisphosphate aldolase, non-catalytic subunit [Ruminiclostridium herbifermentans]